MRLFQRQLAGCLKSGVACINWHCTDSQSTNALRRATPVILISLCPMPVPLRARTSVLSRDQHSPLAWSSDWAAARVLSWSVSPSIANCGLLHREEVTGPVRFSR